MEQRKSMKKGISILLIMVMILGLMSALNRPQEVRANDQVSTVSTINIGTTPLRATPGGWNAEEGLKVYFGQDHGSPMAYRVLGDSPDTQRVSGSGILLDADRSLYARTFSDSEDAKTGNAKQQSGRAAEWKGSELQASLEEKYNGGGGLAIY